MNASVPSLRPYFTVCAAIFAPLLIVLTIVSQQDDYGLADMVKGDAIPEKKVPEVSPNDPPPASTSVAELLDQEFQKLADKVMPSVVSVHTSVEKQNLVMKIVDPQGNLEQLDSEFASQPGVGSGVIVSKEGHILTNWHVIQDLNMDNLAQGRDFLYVSLHKEKSPRQVDIIGVDEKTDLAVLKLRGPLDKNLPVLPFGDSDLIRRGNIVMALGSPFGLSETVTQGILSHCERKLGDTDEGQQYIQSDCVINPGNSGGPLVNLKGEIIGINWAMFIGQPDVHTWQGVGLAIRSNDAKEALEKILNKSGPRGYIGLMFEEQIDIVKDEHKVFIDDVLKGSPAFKAGLRVGDVVAMIDGVEVPSMSDAWKRVQRKKVGETVQFQISRDGTLLNPIDVVVETMDESGSSAQQLVDLTKILGIKVKDGDSRDFFVLNKTRGWRIGRKFIIVKEVTTSSPLYGKVRPGDILMAAGKDHAVQPKINTTKELQSVLSTWEQGSSLTLHFWRDPQTVFALPLTR